MTSAGVAWAAPRLRCPLAIDKPSNAPMFTLRLTVVALAGLLMGPVDAAVPTGYAALVRRAAPSVVTILVVETRLSAADRAALRAERRAAADTDPNAMTAILRRLLSAPGGDAGREEGASGALGSGFVIREDGLIVTNRHVIVGASSVEYGCLMVERSSRRSSVPMRSPILRCSAWRRAVCSRFTWGRRRRYRLGMRSSRSVIHSGWANR